MLWRMRYSLWSPMPSLMDVRIAWASPLALQHYITSDIWRIHEGWGNSWRSRTYEIDTSFYHHSRDLFTHRLPTCSMLRCSFKTQNKGQLQSLLRTTESIMLKSALAFSLQGGLVAYRQFKLRVQVPTHLYTTGFWKITIPGRLNSRSPEHADNFQQKTAQGEHVPPSVHRQDTSILAGLQPKRVQNNLFATIAIEEEAEPKPGCRSSMLRYMTLHEKEVPIMQLAGTRKNVLHLEIRLITPLPYIDTIYVANCVVLNLASEKACV